jgi:hypothetical protein
VGIREIKIFEQRHEAEITNLSPGAGYSQQNTLMLSSQEISCNNKCLSLLLKMERSVNIEPINLQSNSNLDLGILCPLKEG